MLYLSFFLISHTGLACLASGASDYASVRRVSLIYRAKGQNSENEPFSAHSRPQSILSVPFNLNFFLKFSYKKEMFL